MNFHLRIWRQNKGQPGKLLDYELNGVSSDSSFLEMLDLLNEQLIAAGNEPVAFDHDCREGICGMCSLTINGVPQGGKGRTTACQLHMRHFKDGQTITIEPFRAKGFPIIKDLIVDRSAFDRIIQAGGFITARTGSAPDGNAILVGKEKSDAAMDFAACIGCGACVAACPNASAMLFVGAKVSHLNTLPQGSPEKSRRALAMVAAMDKEGFGSCTNMGECQAVCPKGITLDAIAKLNRDYLGASTRNVFSPPSKGSTVAG
jgi:succinate dehydrogenase / fumarate reductase iron-sulfur subunit